MDIKLSDLTVGEILSALVMGRIIEVLRAEEGDSVEILCDNPDPRTPQEANAIVCHGAWTDYKPLRFHAASLYGCLRKAFEARRSVVESGAMPSADLQATNETPHDVLKVFYVFIRTYAVAPNAAFLAHPIWDLVRAVLGTNDPALERAEE